MGHHRLELAEDVAQDALLTALSVWQFEGTPENPAAWLTRVAHNKALDRLRHEKRNQPLDETFDAPDDTNTQIDARHIPDSELELIFLCCHSALDGIDQLALTLRVVSGFTAREISEVFLSTEPAMAQRLSRSKRALKRLDRAVLKAPTVFEIHSRIDAVLMVLYLMFSLGYSPRSGATLVRRDVAMEAVRLAREMADQKYTDRPDAKALASLLCFQASRLNAREDENGLPILLKDQDRQQWDQVLVRLGIAYLRGAMQGREVSRYHLEAGIASLYATAPAWDQIDWQAILGFYDRLVQITDSPVVVINASVAQAFAGSSREALVRLDALAADPKLSGYAPFHIARAEILRLLGRDAEATHSIQTAVSCGASTPVILYLQQRLAGDLSAI